MRLEVGLIDIGGKIPNLALMKISAYHKSMGDTVSPGTGGDITYVSCIFTKHRHYAGIATEIYQNVVVGGPGWDPEVILPPEIEACRPDYSLYGIHYGMGHLTKGCPGDCPWCVVPGMEGRESKTVAQVGDLINPAGDFLVLLDANILACPDWPEHFQEIRGRGQTVHFTQGLDIRYVNDFVASELTKLKVSNFHRTKGQVFFAWDKPENEDHVRSGIATLDSAGFKKWRMRFYVLVGYDTTWEQDWHRFSVLRDLGVEPFIMCYEGAGPKLKAFARWVNRLIYKSCDWKDYQRYSEERSLFAG